MYPKALDCGISITDFWNLSVMEIFDIMESLYRKKKQEKKERLSEVFILAKSTAEHIGTYLNKENKAGMPWDFFPELFREEKAAYEKAVEEEELEKARERRRAYAAEWKRQHGEE